MRTKIRIACSALFLLVSALFATGGALPPQGAVSGKSQIQNAAGFQQFLDRVLDYVNLHKTIEATLPPLEPKEELPEMIMAHQQALARKIRQARPNAKRNDIFTESSRKAFRRAIRSAFYGPQSAHVLATIQQGSPVKEVHLKVNQLYPDGVPHTTVPPTLLQELPKLPDEVEYRIVGRDLVLFDVRANLVVDVLHEILPKS